MPPILKKFKTRWIPEGSVGGTSGIAGSTSRTLRGINTLCKQLAKYQRNNPATQLAGGLTPQTHSSDSAISGQQPPGRSFGLRPLGSHTPTSQSSMDVAAQVDNLVLLGENAVDQKSSQVSTWHTTVQAQSLQLQRLSTGKELDGGVGGVCRLLPAFSHRPTRLTRGHGVTSASEGRLRVLQSTG